MQFFRAEGLWKNRDDSSETEGARAARLSNACEHAKRVFDDNVYCCFSKVHDDVFEIAVACADDDPHDAVKFLISDAGIKTSDLDVEEVTLSRFRHMLKVAERRDLIEGEDAVIEKLGLSPLFGYSSISFGETILPARNSEAVNKLAGESAASDSLCKKLGRIYSGKTRKRFAGHPVHYFVEIDDHDTMVDAYKGIMDALYEKHRILSRRYVFTDVEYDRFLDTQSLEALYKSCKGSAVVVRYKPGASFAEGNTVTGERETIEQLCNALKRYRKDVLTVICLPRDCRAAREFFLQNLEGVCLVEIKENLLTFDRAGVFLKELAKRDSIRPNKALLSMIQEGEEYTANELLRKYAGWYDGRLRGNIFPQYSGMQVVEVKELLKKAEGNAYKELQEMIGLESAKKVIDMALGFHKARKRFPGSGLAAGNNSMHMIFTGAPGTAKTSVARLFARILKQNGILPSGTFVEVGRADLVAKYVGQTPHKVKAAFRMAKGGVLFIDEAYSLVDDRGGLFGDEAINTIVQEMENHRDDVIVIFAGYPDKMEGFLNKNPGLRSRIAFHVPFKDYTVDELCRIADLMARNMGFSLGEGTMDKLETIFSQAVETEDFGNGRYVRNVLEKARMSVAARLVGLDMADIRDSDVSTILLGDIELPDCPAKQKKAVIGFCA